MDEEIERLVVSVRADTSAFARDVAAMRGELEGPLVAGVGRAGRLIDSALARAITTGKTGFDDLKKIALSAMESSAQASLRALFQTPGGGSFGAGLINGLGGLVGFMQPSCPLRPAASPQQMRKPEPPVAESRHLAKLNELLADRREIDSVRKCILVAACEPLAWVDQLDINAVGIIDKIRIRATKHRGCAPEDRFRNRRLGREILPWHIDGQRPRAPTRIWR